MWRIASWTRELTLMPKTRCAPCPLWPSSILVSGVSPPRNPPDHNIHTHSSPSAALPFAPHCPPGPSPPPLPTVCYRQIPTTAPVSIQDENGRPPRTGMD